MSSQSIQKSSALCYITFHHLILCLMMANISCIWETEAVLEWLYFTGPAGALVLGNHRCSCSPRCLSGSPASCFEHSSAPSPVPPLHHWIPPHRSPPSQCCLPSGGTAHLPYSLCGRYGRLSTSSWGECGLSLLAVWSTNCRPESRSFCSGVAVWFQWTCWSSACIWRRPGLGSRK